MKKGRVGKPAKQNNTAVYDLTIKTLGEETLEVLFSLRFPNLKPVRVQALNPEFKDVVWRTGDLLFEVECANGSVWVGTHRSGKPEPKDNKPSNVPLLRRSLGKI